MASGIYLSIIVPIYNSQVFLEQNLAKLDEFIVELGHATELILVDDGSTDSSPDIVKAFAAKPRSYVLHTIRLTSNKGKGAGVAAGMLAATGKYRVFLDADLAYPPTQIKRVLAFLEEGHDVVVANRVAPDSRYTISPAFFRYLYTRHVASRFLNFILRHIVLPNCQDSQAGLKGFKAKAAQEIFSRQIVGGFPFDIEILFLAERMGYRIREIAVDYRYFDEPTTVVFLEDSFQMIKDVARIRLHHLFGRYKLPRHSTRKYLIINADDYAMGLSVTRGILRAAQGGLLKSTSVITNSLDFAASMDELEKSNIKLDVGFHANLTWGRPLLDSSKVKTLVDTDGNFLPLPMLIKRAALRKINADEVYNELHAQCQRLHERCKNITHIDSHHHVHILPRVRKAVEKIAREFNIPFVRSPHEARWSLWHHALLSRVVVRLFAGSRSSYWRSRGFFSPHFFAGFALGSGPSMKKRWMTVLKRLPCGITEIMTHPGYSSPDLNDRYNEEREDEIELLLDNSLMETARDLDIELTSFNNLLEKS